MPVMLRTIITRIKNTDKQTMGVTLSLACALVFLVYPDEAVSITSKITQYAIHHFGLAFIITASCILLLSLAIAISRYGSIRLGDPDERPEFSFFSWISMLFAAGMGSGLIFWGVAEPIFHFADPPAFINNTTSIEDTVLALTYFHWGVHAWSIYAIIGLCMAWFSFNKGRPMTISASFTNSPNRSRLQILDFLAVIAIIFGVAGTLANSIALIQTGLQHTTTLNVTGINFRVCMLAIIAAAFTFSSALGLDRGIKWLSNFNLIFVILVLIGVILWVNPIAVFNTILTSTWAYITELPRLSFSIDPASRQWSENWSVIYFIWWIAWAPFVGPFIARISRGRTIRQFLLCTIFIPTLASIIWFSAFAGGAFELTIFDTIVSTVSQDYTQGLFVFLSDFPYATTISLAMILLLITFVITSADSAVYVIGMLTEKNSLYSKLMWSFILIAITLSLLYENNVDLNKQIAIAGAIPFTLIVIFQAAIITRELIRKSLR